jgi:hypothetical protein
MGDTLGQCSNLNLTLVDRATIWSKLLLSVGGGLVWKKGALREPTHSKVTFSLCVFILVYDRWLVGFNYEWARSMLKR